MCTHSFLHQALATFCLRTFSGLWSILGLYLEWAIHTSKKMLREQSAANDKCELVDRYLNFLPQGGITQANIVHHLPEVLSKTETQWLTAKTCSLTHPMLVSFLCPHHFPISLLVVSPPKLMVCFSILVLGSAASYSSATKFLCGIEEFLGDVYLLKNWNSLLSN